METSNQIQKIYEAQIPKIYETPDLPEKPRTIILWVSRHSPLKMQIRALEYKLGCISIYQVSQVPNAEYVIDVATRIGAKIIIPVLPLSFIARLSELAPKYGLIILWSEMQQIKTLEREPIPNVDYDPSIETVVVAAGAHETKSYRIMRFVKFHKIKAVKLELEEF